LKSAELATKKGETGRLNISQLARPEVTAGIKLELITTELCASDHVIPVIVVGRTFVHAANRLHIRDT
jgi:hypothetical protein